MSRACWLALALLLMLAALAGWRMPRESLDWQPLLAAEQPWRAWTAVAVHYSRLHLMANLAGTLLVAALGVAVPVPPRSTLAWLTAWPLTQWALRWEPELQHYGGLSGVLHAGVAVVTVYLLAGGTPAQRRIGVAILVGLAAKLLSDAPWEGPLRHPAGWDIAVAPMAHVSGALAGVLCAGAVELLRRATLTIERGTR
ncbi:MAG TPA: rhombosortase [Albitalea sp.]|nr:rhombosortase [Albitalea sp.]